ncbi:MAG: hypothetical protein CMK32_09820 [Porticoccaceae bacterium]|nr:hypothetical protein [Porticoccaceae bacterium]
MSSEKPGERRAARRLRRKEAESYQGVISAVPYPVIWSEHAKERLFERFGLFPSDAKMPEKTIQRVGLSKGLFQEYYVRRKQIVYVCKQVDNAVVIKTVLFADSRRFGV